MKHTRVGARWQLAKADDFYFILPGMFIKSTTIVIIQITCLDMICNTKIPQRFSQELYIYSVTFVIGLIWVLF